MSSFTAKSILLVGTLLLAAGACTGLVEAPDEGAGSTSAPQCTSQKYWTEKDVGSEFMHPGGKCNECHNKNMNAPNFIIAGTVYQTFNEPDECNGVNGGGFGGEGGANDVSIVVTDASGRTFPPIPVNSVGNFNTINVTPPFIVKVVKGGRENKMMMPAPHGDCNACHTQMGSTTLPGGTKAPGRVVVPQ